MKLFIHLAEATLFLISNAMCSARVVLMVVFKSGCYWNGVVVTAYLFTLHGHFHCRWPFHHANQAHNSIVCAHISICMVCGHVLTRLNVFNVYIYGNNHLFLVK